MPDAVALIPARSGSERVPGKNVRKLRGHPLLAYAIACARDSGLFAAIVVSTDSEEVAEIARAYGAEVPGLRPVELATATSPDIEWVSQVLGALGEQGRHFQLFSLLRPTSPFRTGATVRRALDELLAHDGADSVRAVELCRQHPGKMWRIGENGLMEPLLEQPAGEVPWHSRQYKSLPEVYVQNSSLEIAWTRIVAEGEIAGESVVPLVTDGWEGFSIDYEDDWLLAERALERGEAELPDAAAAAAEAGTG